MGDDDATPQRRATLSNVSKRHQIGRASVDSPTQDLKDNVTNTTAARSWADSCPPPKIVSDDKSQVEPQIHSTTRSGLTLLLSESPLSKRGLGNESGLPGNQG
ncbi:uncharacterized protein PG986_013459 [Apiospora aurea]|uniref:Uncharacterized protein n=1 Tax=Apiospora aurea TaxID=335848 RepID=A0ABR1PVL9_9PEZI